MSEHDVRTDLFRTRPAKRLGALTQLALHRSGLGGAFVRVRRLRGAVILMYHAIVREEDERWIDPRFSVPFSAFIEQMRFLADHRRVVSLDDLVAAVGRGRTLPRGSVAITFDDGYRSTLDLAAPVLEHYGLPATVYLATGYVSRRQPQWIDALYAAFAHRGRDRLDLSEAGLAPIDLGEPAALQHAYARLDRRLLGSTVEQRARLLDLIEDQLRPTARPPRLTLGWEEVDALRRRHPRFDIGVHTRDHTDLAAAPRAVVEAEVDGCVADVQRELGVSPKHFSYPYGRSDRPSRRVVEARGLLSAAMTDPPQLVRADSDRLSLPRLTAPRDMSLFPFWTSGAYPALARTVPRAA